MIALIAWEIAQFAVVVYAAWHLQKFIELWARS